MKIYLCVKHVPDSAATITSQAMPIEMRMPVRMVGAAAGRMTVVAVRNGVRRAHILDGRIAHVLLLELFTDDGIGTMVTGTDTKVATARRQRDLDDLAQQGLEAIHLELDQPTSVAAAVTQVLERCEGHVFGLFNNEAYGQPGAVEDLTWEVLEAQLRTNLLGWHELTRLLIPGMRQRGEFSATGLSSEARK